MRSVADGVPAPRSARGPKRTNRQTGHKSGVPPVAREASYDVRFFKNVLNSIPYPHYLVDARNLTVVWTNSAAGHQELPEGAKCYAYVHGRDRPCAQMGRLCLLVQARMLRRLVLFEETCVDGAGNSKQIEFQGFPVFDAHGNLTHLLESRVDISPRKRAQEALYESEQKYRMLFHEANDAIFLIDGGSGYVVDANREAERLLALPIDQILVMHESELLTPQTIDQMHAESEARARAGNVVDAQIVRRDGCVVPVCISSSEVTLHGRRVVQRVFKDMTQYKQAEARLMEYQRELKSLASRLSLAQERERRRIAAQVHDSIGQTMAVCSMKLGALGESLASTAFAPDIAYIETLLKQTIEETRKLAYEISSPLLYEVGLEAAVEKLADQMKERSGIQFSFVHDGSASDGSSTTLDNDTRATVFEAVRELLVNAAKHSKARHVEIDMRKKGGSLCTVVADDGVGFDSSQTAPGLTAKGFGLFSIRERIESVGGHMIVKSQRGAGTRVLFSVPLRKG